MPERDPGRSELRSGEERRADHRCLRRVPRGGRHLPAEGPRRQGGQGPAEGRHPRLRQRRPEGRPREGQGPRRPRCATAAAPDCSPTRSTSATTRRWTRSSSTATRAVSAGRCWSCNDGKTVLTRKHIEDIREGKISWSDLIREGVIEWIDAEEEEDAFICRRALRGAGEMRQVRHAPCPRSTSTG